MYRIGNQEGGPRPASLFLKEVLTRCPVLNVTKCLRSDEHCVPSFKKRTSDVCSLALLPLCMTITAPSVRNSRSRRLMEG